MNGCEMRVIRIWHWNGSTSSHHLPYCLMLIPDIILKATPHLLMSSPHFPQAERRKMVSLLTSVPLATQQWLRTRYWSGIVSLPPRVVVWPLPWRVAQRVSLQRLYLQSPNPASARGQTLCFHCPTVGSSLNELLMWQMKILNLLCPLLSPPAMMFNSWTQPAVTVFYTSGHHACYT